MRKVIVLLTSGIMVIISLTISIISYCYDNDSLLCMIFVGVLASAMTLFPVSLIDFLYERKRRIQDFITAYNGFLKYFGLLNKFECFDYINKVGILSHSILELGLISKKKGSIAQKVYNILIDNTFKLAKNRDFQKTFNTIKEKELDSLIDQLQ